MKLSYPDRWCTVASGGAHIIRGVLYTKSPNTWFLELPAVAVLGPSCNAQELSALCCWESPTRLTQREDQAVVLDAQPTAVEHWGQERTLVKVTPSRHPCSESHLGS